MTSKGLRLKLARKAAELSQKELGDRLGVGQAFVSRVENGSGDGTVSFWCDVARLLNVSLNYLLLDDAPAGEDPAVAEPLLRNRLAVLADYTLPPGLRELAADQALCDTLQITDDDWVQLCAIPQLQPVAKDGFLQLLITLRSIRPSPLQIDEPNQSK